LSIVDELTPTIMKWDTRARVADHCLAMKNLPGNNNEAGAAMPGEVFEGGMIPRMVWRAMWRICEVQCDT